MEGSGGGPMEEGLMVILAKKTGKKRGKKIPRSQKEKRELGVGGQKAHLGEREEQGKKRMVKRCKSLLRDRTKME